MLEGVSVTTVVTVPEGFGVLVVGAGAQAATYMVKNNSTTIVVIFFIILQ
jgi:hypothetical protein